MARRAKRTTRRKKKKDPTAIIITCAGVAFALVIGIVLLMGSSPSTNKQSGKSVASGSKTLKNGDKPTTTSIDAKQRKSFQHKPKQPARSREQSPKLRKPFQPAKSPIDANTVPNRNARANSLSIQSVNTLPVSLALPEKPIAQENLTEGIGFSDAGRVKIKFHSANYIAPSKPSIDCSDPEKGQWQFNLTNSDTPLASLKISKEGLLFQWDPNSTATNRSMLRNCKLTFSDNRSKKTVQLRPIQKAPEIKLFSRDAENEYSLRIFHAPGEIYWSLEPTDKTLAPFDFPTVGAPTTDGPIPLDESLEWTPENDTGIVKARYTWHCSTKSGIKPNEKRIVIRQKKEYKIGETSWRPLTTDSLREDFDKRLKKYDNVISGIKRKWLKGKPPNLAQVTKLREMIREGAAFADVRSFYYAVPDRKIKLEFRTPCGTTDTLLAQYPVDPESVEQIKTPTLPTFQETPTEIEAAPASDDTWTLPPGENPWKARQQQLDKMSRGKK